MVNRPIDCKAVHQLIENMHTNSNLRIRPDHHAKGTIDNEIKQEILHHHKISAKSLLKRSARAEYVLLDHDWMVQREYQVRLEAGQHRLTVQDEIKANDEDDWWPMDLYVLPLSHNALKVLRNNDKQHHSELNDGMRLVNLFKAEDEIARAKQAGNQELVNAYYPIHLVANFRLTIEWKSNVSKLNDRGKQLWGRQDLHTIIRWYIGIPGLRDKLTFGTFDNFVKF